MTKRTPKRANGAEPPEIRLKKQRNPNPPLPPVEHRFKPGQSGNPGGRPKGARILSQAYLDKLAEVGPDGRTYAELVASGQVIAAIGGDARAAREIRQATEGDTLHLVQWQIELVAALKEGRLLPEHIVRELGIDDARPILIAAGQAVPAGTPNAAAVVDTGAGPEA